jgi:hypothetical protein
VMVKVQMKMNLQKTDCPVVTQTPAAMKMPKTVRNVHIDNRGGQSVIIISLA